MTPTTLYTATAVERAALRPAEDEMRLRHTGIGPARAAASATGTPGATMIAGLAGALTADARPGELIVADEIRDAQHSYAVPSAPLLAAALRRLGLTVRVGPLVSRPQVVDHPDERAELAATGAVAVDMETATLAAAAAGHPFAAVRAVVDTPELPLRRLGTLTRGTAGLRSLRAAIPALRQWSRAAGEREVLLANPRSFCAGVDRAVETVQRALQRYGAPVYVRRQIVHNTHVVRELEGQGAIFVGEVDEVPVGATLVFAAHGVSPQVRAQAQRHELSVIDATCPLVTKVHAETRRYSAAGDTVFLIGHAEHEEVEGTVGEAPDDVVVVADVEQAMRVQPRDPQRVSYAMQTTLAHDEAEEIAAVLRHRFPAMRSPRTDDICYATTNRQRAVRAIAAEADLVFVVGSGNSSNSRRLVEVAERAGAQAQLVEDVGEIELERLAGVRTLGLTAGASAPPHLVDEIVQCLGGLGQVTVRENGEADEDVTFALPREVS